MNYRSVFSRVWFVCLVLGVMCFLSGNNGVAYAAHSMSITSSGVQSVNLGSNYGGVGTAISEDDITITTTCNAGYNFMISTSVDDNNLYYDGDSGAGSYFSPSDGNTALKNAANTWGYYYGDTDTPTDESVFSAVPVIGNEAMVRTVSETTGSGTIEDRFGIYYGVAAGVEMPIGTYKMKQDDENVNGTIVYYLTMAEECQPVYMQDVTNEKLSSLIPNEQDSWVVTDKRDGNEYRVMKMNGNYWMVDNLRLAAGSELNSENSNVVQNYTLPYNDLATTEACASISTADAENGYNTACLHEGVDGHNKETMWYNYCAASAGTNCQSGSIIKTAGDICPAGWSLPTNEQALELIANNRALVDNYFADYGGIYLEGTLRNKNNTNYWTSSVGSAINQYSIYYNLGQSPGTYSDPKHRGFYVRCVKAKDSVPVTVEFAGGGVESVTFVNDDDSDDIQTVTSNGQSIVLGSNQSYGITVTLEDGAKFVSWEKVSGGGSFEPVSEMNTHYTSGADLATLRVTAGNTLIKTSTGIDSVKVMKDGNDICNTSNMVGEYCTLSDGAVYDIIATVSRGYLMGAWNNTGGSVITDVNSMSTSLTFNVGEEIEEIVASANPDSYAVTVLFGDENVTSITINGTTVESSGQTISMVAGTRYSIEYTTALSDVIFTTTENGDLFGKSYAIYGDATLTASSVDKTYMQNVTEGTLENLIPEVNNTVMLYDSRDEKAYTISRLVDGNYWMLDNMSLDIGDATILGNMNSTNTNASDRTLGYLKGEAVRDPETDVDGNYATAGITDTWTSNSYSAPMIYTKNKDSMPVAEKQFGNGTHKYGILYNYCAASAGSYCYGNGEDFGVSVGNASEDVCPAGWRMPIGGEGEFDTLCNALSGSDCSGEVDMDPNDINSVQSVLSAPFAGRASSATVSYRGTYDLIWSSTVENDYDMFAAHSQLSTFRSQTNIKRIYGASVRCVLDTSE